MRAVRDDAGRLAVLLERSDGDARVRDPDTGAERTLPADRLAPAGDPAAFGDEPGRDLPPSARRVLAVADARALAVLLVLDAGPRSVRTLLDRHPVCESDLQGAVADLRAAGLVEPTDVGGEPGYRTTDPASEGLAALHGGSADRA